MSTTDDRRNSTIDILRGCSAIAVAVFHFNAPYPALPDVYHGMARQGWIGVSVFFVLSGFCISAAASKQKGGVTMFWFRRLMRIYPPYWASLLLVLWVVALRLTTSGANDVTGLPKDAVSWFYTVTALTSPASHVPTMNWVYWSLSYELAFYIMMGLLFFRAVGPAMIALSLIALFKLGYPFDQWGLFGLGVGCHILSQRRFVTAACILAICLAQVFLRQNLNAAVAGTFAAILIIFPPNLALSQIVRPLKQAGLFSYSLYLVHVPIGCFLIPNYMPWKLGRQFWPSLLQDSILLVCCLAVARFFYIAVERPAHEYARRRSLRPN